ncbi:toprim domain-containing protein [Nocardia sp. NBC_01503]|uniref:toprim domain-containing protein n=1 Tax=Nocardia sp. NBC_01503 TaxID=2975997 RepID=UPI002E7B19A7|nr:toprim domain-containing protein [Nocardia sp. NBC_01503]WTL34420.1 toprim domain-containing protein [Nocardia sp. NBC_01503]
MEPPPPQGRSWQVINAALTAAMGPGKDRNRWTLYLCPVHEADGQHHTPSLGVRYDPAQGKTIVRCFAHCDDKEVLSKVNLQVRDMWDRLPERNPNRSQRQPDPRVQQNQSARMSLVDKAIEYAQFPIPEKPNLGEPTGPAENVCTYVYRWPEGVIAGAVTRMRTPHEYGEAKSFWQARWSGTEWEHTGFAPVPFRLPEVLDAVDRGREIYICEGEKDVQRAYQAGLVATCNAMGAGSWTPEHAHYLTGAGRVVVIADRDRPGYRHAAKVAETLHGRVGEVRVLQAAAGKDLSDHLDAGHEIEDLQRVPYLDRHYQQQRGRTETRSR